MTTPDQSDARPAADGEAPSPRRGAWLRTLLDRFIAPAIVGGEFETLRRFRLLVGINLVLLLLALVSLPLVIPQEGLTGLYSLTLLVASALYACNLVITRTARSWQMPATTLLAELALVCGMQLFLGDGLHSQTMVWNALLPVVAVLLVGRRGGQLMAGVVLLEMIVLYALEAGAGVYAPPVPGVPAISHLTSFALFMGFCLFLALSSDSSRKAALASAEADHRIALSTTVAREAAREAERAKSEFLATMSHELRTPLNAVIGYAELLQETSSEHGHAMYGDDLGKIREAGSHLLGIINDILDLTRLEAGKLELRPADLDLADFVGELAALVRPRLGRQDNTLRVTIAAPVGTAHLDGERLRQVLLNLLDNAAKFTREGLVTLALTEEHEAGARWLRFEVKDTGIGMSTEQQKKLFRRFTQVDSSPTRSYEGTGIGLAICRELCECMRGQIRVRSRLGEGSTFTVRVPANQAAPHGTDNGGSHSRLRGPDESTPPPLRAVS